MSLVETNKGRFLEDFAVGDVLKHKIGRTILDIDNTWFTCATLNMKQQYFNDDFDKKAGSEGVPVNPCFLLALTNSLAVADTSRNGMVVGWENVKVVDKAYVGDTIYAKSVVAKVKESKSRPGVGFVTFNTTAATGEGKVVMTFDRTVMCWAKESAPANSKFPEEVVPEKK